MIAVHRLIWTSAENALSSLTHRFQSGDCCALAAMASARRAPAQAAPSLCHRARLTIPGWDARPV